MTIILDGTAGIANNATDLSYTGTLTGSTGVVNIGSGQVYKDASGNVGIGTTSPASKLSVVVPSANTDTANSIRIYDVGGTNGNNYGLGFFSDTGRFAYTAGTGGFHAWYTANTERARIDSSGNLLVGTTSANASGQSTISGASATLFPLIAQGTNGTSPRGIGVFYTAASPNNTNSDFLYCQDTSAVRIRLLSNGGISNFQANNVNLSDRREKINFVPAKSYLDVICAIPVQTFNYIDQNMEEDAGLTLGVIAQDVQAVAPEMVMESNWGTKEDPKMRLSIYQTDLQYALMKCIQEQQAIITALTTRITALEAANV